MPRNLIAIFFNTQLPLNEDGIHLNKQLSCMNYKGKVKNYMILVGKNSYHTSADDSMLGYGCGVSQYLQFFVEDLDIYQMLSRPYLRSFDGGPGDKLIKQNWVINLENRAETFVWECIESRIMSDDKGEKYISQYWSNLKQKL